MHAIQKTYPNLSSCNIVVQSPMNMIPETGVFLCNFFELGHFLLYLKSKSIFAQHLNFLFFKKLTAS